MWHVVCAMQVYVGIITVCIILCPVLVWRHQGHWPSEIPVVLGPKGEEPIQAHSNPNCIKYQGYLTDLVV